MTMIRMDYEAVDEMIIRLENAQSRLNEVNEEIMAISREFGGDDTCLVGEAGDALQQALSRTLTAQIEGVIACLDNRQEFIRLEKEQMMRADGA